MPSWGRWWPHRSGWWAGEGPGGGRKGGQGGAAAVREMYLWLKTMTSRRAGCWHGFKMGGLARGWRDAIQEVLHQGTTTTAAQPQEGAAPAAHVASAPCHQATL
jgi:hypothetical protein